MAWSSSDRRSQLPKDWTAIRRRVLRRDGNRCTVTVDGVRCPKAATDVHHTAGRDDHRLEVLVSLCSDHHDEVTKRQAAIARQTTRHPAERHPGVKVTTPGG